MVSPLVWGKEEWKVDAMIILGAPESPSEEWKNAMKQRILGYQYLLPCQKCALGSKDILDQYPLTDDVLSSRNNLIKWYIDFHNAVNQKLGKPIYSYEQGYQAMLGHMYINQQNLIFVVFAILILVILLLKIYF